LNLHALLAFGDKGQQANSKTIKSISLKLLFFKKTCKASKIAETRAREDLTVTGKGTWEMITATIIPAAPGVELLHFLAGHLTECLRQGTWILYAKSGTARTPALSPQP
jgi:hypothetical protein